LNSINGRAILPSVGGNSIVVLDRSSEGNAACVGLEEAHLLTKIPLAANLLRAARRQSFWPRV